jgi:hypothetical protein
MARELTAEELACFVDEPDWNNSDASSDVDDNYFRGGLQTGDPLQQAQDGSETDEDSEPTQPPPPVTSSTEISRSGTLPVAFDHPVGPSVNMASTSTALDFFNETFGNDVMEHMVQETNIYASQNPPSERYKWYSTTVTEMYLFLAIIIAMGVHKLPFVHDYWSSDCLLGVPSISAGMPIDHFKALLRCLHLSDNSKTVPRNQPGYNRLHKIRPIIDRLRETWRTVYNPPKEQSIDEAMVGFKGRNSMKQYMPMKPTKRGYKVWCRCSPNGFTNDCEVYEGATDQRRETSLSTAVVLGLAKYIYDKGHHLFFDNYFSSVDLAEELLQHNTHCCGTAQSNRRRYPPSLKKVSLQRGEHRSETVGNVHCFVWKDRKNIDFIQTICGPNELASVQRKNKDGSRTTVTCPLAVN